MGKRYEKNRQNVDSVIEDRKRIAEETKSLESEYSALASIDSLLSDVDDESLIAIEDVKSVKESEQARLERETQENDKERKKIENEIDNEIEKLQTGLEKMASMEKLQFGRDAVAETKTEYKTQIGKYNDLIKKLDGTESLDSGSADNIGYEAEDTGLNEQEEVNIIKDFVGQNVSKPLLPTNGEWSDPSAVGNSDFIISDDAQVSWQKNGKHSCTGAELKQWMSDNYGTNVVHYDHNEPVFIPFIDKEIGFVYLDAMSTDRSGGEGTFAKANQEALNRLGFDALSDVKEYMNKNELTWHECADGHTVIAIPTRINASFKHSGGISLERSLESVRETISEQTGGAHLKLQKESRGGLAEGVQQAIDAQHQNFRDTKKRIFKKDK